MLRRLGRLLFSGTLGLMVGGAVVVWVMYTQAVADVEALLARPVWGATGRVLSAPMALWPGMHLAPAELATDLQSAGYARVRELRAPRDFVLSGGDAVRILTEADETVTVRFAEGEIASVEPGGMVRLGAVELAELRGPEGISRRPVRLGELPEHLPRAILAMEDARFFDHEGVDPVGITRAVVANAVSGYKAQGGSTLTQQLVKNLFLTSERTYERKAREALLAVALESCRSKEQILELYLNEIYLGQVGGAAIAGVDQAARVYFGKGAERLEVGEAATLAGIISAPNRYSPLRHPERALERRDLALTRMAEVGWLDAAAAEAERSRPLMLAPTPTSRRSPWLVEAAVETVESAVEEEGVITGQGWTVRTTLQPALQRIAESVVADSLAALVEENPDAEGAEMALVALRASDGAVLAMVGGRSYADSQFNRVTSGARQIGSTVKPLTYLAALDSDHSRSPGTQVMDEPIERAVPGGAPWKPKNYDGRYRGEVSYRRALADSRNIPAVLVAEAVGMGRLSERWQELGLSGATALPSAALGSFEATPLELAGAYTVFPNGGEVVTPRFVVDAIDKDGAPAWRSDPRRRRVASAEATWMVTSMLQDVILSGTARSAPRYGLQGPAAGKTGTTDAARDAWFVGYTADVVVAVWVGFDRGQNLGLTGGKAALPAWARFLDRAGIQGDLPPPPDGLVEVEICAESLSPSACTEACETPYPEWFFADEAPTCEDDAEASPLRSAISRLLSGSGDEEDDVPPGDNDAGEGIPPRRGLFGRRGR